MLYPRQVAVRTDVAGAAKHAEAKTGDALRHNIRGEGGWCRSDERIGDRVHHHCANKKLLAAYEQQCQALH